ncbi:hypothetical protein D9613_012427 [Agrocybe pediades]|uniref:Rho-GAP domain-containing protein n=1 Tax=Agrocybe pediades TaxID=84607 RepID=A0A8H4QRW2_9AGAR|nr:hypothetical protein D9613_012427 [Agrocybe pediades]
MKGDDAEQVFSNTTTSAARNPRRRQSGITQPYSITYSRPSPSLSSKASAAPRRTPMLDHSDRETGLGGTTPTQASITRGNTVFNAKSTPVPTRKSKMTTYQTLSKTGTTHLDVPAFHNELTPIASSSQKRRFVSMPQPLPSTTPLHNDAHYHHHHSRHPTRGVGGLASPPIIDFTRFEDLYRGPRDQNFEGLIARRTTRTKNGRHGMRSSSSGVKPALKTETPARIGHPGGSSMSRTRTCGASSSGRNVPPTPQAASERKPDPRLLFSAVDGVLMSNGSGVDLRDYLDKDELLAAHQLDQLDFEEREMVASTLERTGKLEVRGLEGPLTVLGEPVRKASIYASATMILGGREHQLPIVVINSVEELYRTGIYQPNLFRTLPNRQRLLELMNIFDSEEQIPGSLIRSRNPSSSSSGSGTSRLGFGSNTSLHLESTPDICALLTTYLSSLPEPIMDQKVFEAIWDLCGVEEDEDDEDDSDDEDFVDDGGGGGGHAMDRKPDSSFRLSQRSRRRTKTSTSPLHRQSASASSSSAHIPIPLARTYTTPAESAQITLAQLLLHLLPSPNFSLILYLLAFFSQVALVREENGVGVEDLARMFGGRIFGGSAVPLASQRGSSMRNQRQTHACPVPSPIPDDGTSKEDYDSTDDEDGPSKAFNTTLTRRQGETMMAWFLRRWGPISETLFDVVEDAKMGLFRRPAVRRDSFGRDVLFSAAGTREEQEEERVGKGRKTPTQSTAPRGVARAPTIRVDAARQVGPTPQSHSTPRKAVATRVAHEVPEDDDEVDYVVLSSAHTSDYKPTSAHGGHGLPMTPGVDEILEYHRGGLTPSTMTEVDDDSFYSLPSVDERLMDVSMPRSLINDTTLMNTFDVGGNAQDERGYGEDESSSSTGDVLPTILNPNSSSPRHLNPSLQSHILNTHPGPDPDPGLDTEAETRVSSLEHELRARTAELGDALRELANSRREYAFLAKRLEELEGEKEVAAAAAAPSGSPTPFPVPPAPSAPLSTSEGVAGGGGKGGRAGHFVEHLDDDDEDEDEELEDEYAAVYDLMETKMKGVGRGGRVGERKPVPRN